MNSADVDYDAMLEHDMGRFFDDPLGFVMFAYDWKNDKALHVCRLPEPYCYAYDSEYGPDLWACDLLTRIGEKVRANGFDPLNPVPVDPLQEAIASGHGIGKSALVGWLVDWIMSTRPGSKGTVTANTSEQLATKTWAEVAKWTSKCITSHWFRVTTGKGAMKMVRIGAESSWFCSAQTCDEENSESFAGQHAATATSFYIFDEASKIPNKIEEVSEGGLTDGEPMRFAFGNPTRSTGWFADIFNTDVGRKRWGTAQIDSRKVQITNKRQHAKWIEDYGIDSDFVKVRILGMFPNLSALQLISTADVDAAAGRHLRQEQYSFAPIILTLDNAWTGDDEGAIVLRQGLYSKVLRTFAKNDNDIEIARMLAALEDEYKADGVVIDGGFGTGVFSAGKTWERGWHIVWFSGKAPEVGYLNLRAYIWVKMRDWLKAGGAIDAADYQLRRELTSVELVGRMDGAYQLEAKEDTKDRAGFSPNRADALAISFAVPIVHKQRDLAAVIREHQQRAQEYDPLTRMSTALEPQPEEYDPLRSM